MLKLSVAVCILFGVCCAQVYIPTGVSTSSGIVRNVPTTLLRIPANTYITDGNRVYLAAPFPLQFTRFNDDFKNENNNKFTSERNDKVQDLRKLTTDRDDRTKALLREDKEDKLRELERTLTMQRDDLLKTTDDRNEKLRDLLKFKTDKVDDTYRTENFDKDQPRTLTKFTTGGYDADTLTRIQGFNEFDRFGTLNRFRDVNEFDRTFGRY